MFVLVIRNFETCGNSTYSDTRYTESFGVLFPACDTDDPSHEFMCHVTE